MIPEKAERAGSHVPARIGRHRLWIFPETPVLGRKLEKSAFRTRIPAADLVTRFDGFREGANRLARLYRLMHRQLVYFPRAVQATE